MYQKARRKKEKEDRQTNQKPYTKLENNLFEEITTILCTLILLQKCMFKTVILF